MTNTESIESDIKHMAEGWRHRNLLSMESLSSADILTIIDTALLFKSMTKAQRKSLPWLPGRTICHLFQEASTRTKTSFGIAARQLGCDVTELSVNTSSMQKGENLKDTIKVIEAMDVEGIIVRHSSSGATHYIAGCFNGSVLNAGDGNHEHPSQALLDLMTIKERVGHIQGLNIAIIGDILHSRVARSNMIGMTVLDNQVTLVAPPTLLPEVPEYIQTTSHINDVLEESDVVMLLRLQLERETGGYIPSVREYSRLFGLTRERTLQLKEGAVIMHPGPINRGIEMSNEAADGMQSAILNQVENGIYVRMAILYLLMGNHK